MEVSLHKPRDLSTLRHLVSKEADAKQRDRYRAIVLALEGMIEPEIRLRLGRSRGFIQRWVYAYRDDGISGLIAKKPPGLEPKLPRYDEAKLKAKLDQPGAPRRGRDVAALLRKQFGVSYSVRGALLLLHRLGYEPLKPRPVNPKKSSDAEQQWRTTAPFLSKTSSVPIPTSKLKSGSRTKVGSGKRDA